MQSISPIEQQQNKSDQVKKHLEKISSRSYQSDSNIENNQLSSSSNSQSRDSDSFNSKDFYSDSLNSSFNSNNITVNQDKSVEIMAKSQFSKDSNNNQQKKNILNFDMLKQQSQNLDQKFRKKSLKTLKKESSMPALDMVQMKRKKSIMGGIKKKVISLSDDQDEQENLIHILQQKEKSKSEKQYMQKALQHMPLFKDKKEIFLQNKEAMQLLIDEIQYKFYPKNKEIIRFGEFGTKYYIIIKGSCNVLVPNQDTLKQSMQQQYEVPKEDDDKNDNKNRKQEEKKQNEGQLQEEKSLAIGSSNNSGTQSPQVSSFRQSTVNNQQIPKLRASQQVNFAQKVGLAQSVQMFKSKMMQTSGGQRANRSKAVFQQNDSDKKSLLSQLIGNMSGQKEEQEKKKYEGFHQVATMKAGSGFGEIALITKQRRTATVVANEDAHMIEFSKASYEKIFSVYQKYQLMEKMNFYKQYDFLQKMPNSTILSIVLDSEIKVFEKHQHIYRKNDDIKNIYFVKSGEVELSTEVNINEEMNIPISKQQDQEQQSSNFKYNSIEQHKQKQKKMKKIILGILGPVTYFGDEEILHKSNKRMADACVLSKAEVYAIKKEILLTKLSWWNSLEDFKRYAENKTIFHKNRINDISNIQQLQQQESSSKSPQKKRKQSKSQKNKIKNNDNNGNKKNIQQKQQRQQVDRKKKLQLTDFNVNNDINNYLNNNQIQVNFNLSVCQSPMNTQRVLPYIQQQLTCPNNNISHSMSQPMNNISTSSQIYSQPSQKLNVNFQQQQQQQQKRYVIDSQKNIDVSPSNNNYNNNNNINNNNNNNFSSLYSQESPQKQYQLPLQFKSMQREARQTSPSLILSPKNLNINTKFQQYCNLNQVNSSYNSIHSLPLSPKQQFSYQNNNTSINNQLKTINNNYHDDSVQSSIVQPFYNNSELNKHYIQLQQQQSQLQKQRGIFLSARLNTNNNQSQQQFSQQTQNSRLQSQFSSQELQKDFFDTLSYKQKELLKQEQFQIQEQLQKQYQQQLQQIKQKSNKQLEITLNKSLRRRQKYLKQLNSQTTGDYFLPYTNIKACLHERDYFRSDLSVHNSNSNNQNQNNFQNSNIHSSQNSNNLGLVSPSRMSNNNINNNDNIVTQNSSKSSNNTKNNSSSNMGKKILFTQNSKILSQVDSSDYGTVKSVRNQNNKKQQSLYDSQNSQNNINNNGKINLQLGLGEIEEKNTNLINSKIFHYQQSKNQFFLKKQQQQKNSTGNNNEQQQQQQKIGSASQILSPKSSVHSQDLYVLHQKQQLEEMLKQNNNNYNTHIQKQNQLLFAKQQQQRQEKEQQQQLILSQRHSKQPSLHSSKITESINLNKANSLYQQQQQQLINQQQKSLQQQGQNNNNNNAENYNEKKNFIAQIKKYNKKISQHSNNNSNVNQSVQQNQHQKIIKKFQSQPISKTQLEGQQFSNQDLNSNQMLSHKGENNNIRSNSSSKMQQKRSNIRNSIVETILQGLKRKEY